MAIGNEKVSIVTTVRYEKRNNRTKIKNWESENDELEEVMDEVEFELVQ